MSKDELAGLLQQIAESDLVDGADIYDHPCTVAVRAINKCFDDIEYLRTLKRNGGGKSGLSKKARMMLELRYNPSW